MEIVSQVKPKSTEDGSPEVSTDVATPLEVDPASVVLALGLFNS